MASKVDILLGLQWGDEGKGKLVDVLTPRYEIIARFQGGPNAGHTLEFDGGKHVLHTIPSGIFHDHVTNIVGNGVVIDPIIFSQEIDLLREKNVPVSSRLMISRKAHIIVPTHRMLDKASEMSKGASKIGSTLKGIGPAYMDKTGRNGIRVGDLFESDFNDRYTQLKNKHLKLLESYREHFTLDPDELSRMEHSFFEGVELIKSLRIEDSEWYINQALLQGKTILAEGAQGSLLDIDFGSYPFVTSSNTVAAGACTGLGIAPNKTGEVIGVFKAYCTRVGSGPFPTELNDETGEAIRKEGNEYGSTTGRSRRCGWLDLPALRYACMINGVTQLMMMKADVLSIFEEILVCTHYEIDGKQTEFFPYDAKIAKAKPVYESHRGWKSDLTFCRRVEDLPQHFVRYIKSIEDNIGIPIVLVSVGPDRSQTIELK